MSVELREQVTPFTSISYGEARKVESAKNQHYIGTQEKRRLTRSKTLAIINLLGEGYSYWEIGKKLRMNQDALQRYKVRICKILQETQGQKIEELILYTQLRHGHIYKKAMEAFEESRTDSKGNKRAGNSVYLQVANESLRDLRKLLGLDRSNDFINNGHVNLFNWDSLHSRQVNLPQSLPNSQPSALSSSQEMVRIDPVEERIRQLELLAAQKQRENEGLIEKHGPPENDHADSPPVEEIQRRIVLKAVKPVEQKTESKVSIVAPSLDDLLG